MARCEMRSKLNAAKELALLALHPCVMGTPTVAQAGPVSRVSPPALSNGLGKRTGGRVCCGRVFFALFSELNFIMRVHLLKCRRGTSIAELNTAVLCHCRLSFHSLWHQQPNTGILYGDAQWGSWCLNKISNFLGDAKGVRALGWGYKGCTAL